MNKTEYKIESYQEKMKLSQMSLKGPKTFKIPVRIKNSDKNTNANAINDSDNITGSFPNIRPLDILKNMYSDEAGKTIRLIQENKKSMLFKTEINR
jgi:hypothetical protein